MVSLDLDELASMSWAAIARMIIANLNDADWEEFVEQHWERYFSRPDALLTDKQRRFILGLVEYSGENPRQQRYEMRKRIRRRFEGGIADLSLLALLDDNSKDDISERLGKENLVASAADLLQFVYVSTGEREDLNEAVRRAVYNAESSEPSLGESKADPRDVDVKITVEYQPDYDSIYEKYINGGIQSLRPREVGHLIMDQRLKPEEIQDYYEGNESLSESDLFDGIDGVNRTESANKEGDEDT